jgi:ubiquinone biosynthesis protein COQ9
MLQSPSPFKTKFLLTALPDVPFDGWTPELMARTADRLKIGEERLLVEFPEGERDLVLYFSFWATEETLKRLTKRKLADLRVRDRITLGVRTRLEILSPHKQAMAAALAFMARPPLSFFVPKLIWHAADKIWWAGGDTATDYNHYTKRALLSGVITATTLFWLNDSSKNHEQTWAFLDRRIDNVLKVGMKIAQLKKKSV